MRLITSISIEGFRSFALETFSDIGDCTTIIGKNSSGKSNVLRALNLFFNSRVDEGNIDFDRELHHRPLRKQKKRIRISIDFKIPASFRFRKELKALEGLGDSFTIVRTWELDHLRSVVSTATLMANGREMEDGTDLVRSFLSLISYRYIPNRTVPAELLRKESQAIAAAIFLRMKDGGKATEVLENLTASANRMLEGAAAALDKTGAGISHPTVATAGTLGEMLTMKGFTAVGMNGAAVKDEDWGAGHQAYFLFNVLKQLDTSYGRFFGWKQATIWGVEEPESGLHQDLQTQLAKQLLEWGKDSGTKLQLFVTTHSPVFAMTADTGFWIEAGETASTAQAMETPRLVRAAEDKGVCSYLHPVLAFPWNPVVLVEGPNDEKALNHVASLLGRGTLKFTSLSTMDYSEGSGKDSIIAYLKRNQSLIQKRPKDSPLLVCFDWDVSPDDLKKARAAYGPGAEDYVFRMDTRHCHIELGTDFKGVERFYPPSIVKAAHDAEEFIVGFPPTPGSSWSISKSELSKGKQRLLERLLLQKKIETLQPLARVVEDAYQAAQTYAEQQRKLIFT